MTEIILSIGQVEPDQYDAFEAELAKYNLTPRINPVNSALITITIKTNSEYEEDLVKELAALCFGIAPTV